MRYPFFTMKEPNYEFFNSLRGYIYGETKTDDECQKGLSKFRENENEMICEKKIYGWLFRSGFMLQFFEEDFALEAKYLFFLKGKALS